MGYCVGFRSRNNETIEFNLHANHYMERIEVMLTER